jgi:hypothetical protein
MTKPFQHLLLTRFNTALQFAASSSRLNSEWLQARLGLFERYCLPSVAGQRNTDFRWLVFFDAESPQWFKDKVATFEPLLEPVYIEGLATDDVLARKVAQSGIASSPYLITTRLDNDDAISRDYIASVQRAFRGQNREFLTFPFGLQSFRGHLYNVYWQSNPFLSLIEKVGEGGNVTTVFCVAHDRVTERNSLKTVLRAPRWLQVIHGSNLANVLRGWPRLNSLSHPDFNVVWPEVGGPDSMGLRFRFFAEVCGARADRLAKKLGVF